MSTYMSYAQEIDDATDETFNEKLETLANMILSASCRCTELGGQRDEILWPFLSFAHSEIKRKLKTLQKDKSRFSVEEITEKLTRKEENHNETI